MKEIKTKVKPAWKQEGFKSKADWLDNKLAERGVTFKDLDDDKGRLVCVANILTGEVLRVPIMTAFHELIQKYPNTWYFTNKSIYKLYKDSHRLKKPEIAPKFVREIAVMKKGKEIMQNELINVFVGEPSARLNKRKSSCNKKGKYRFQLTEHNTVYNKDGEAIERPARVIRHLDYSPRKKKAKNGR